MREFCVQFFVVRHAKPNNIKRGVIVRVMRFHIIVTADKARLFLQSSIPNSVADLYRCCATLAVFRVVASPCASMGRLPFVRLCVCKPSIHAVLSHRALPVVFLVMLRV